MDPESHVSWMSPELFSGETNDDSNRFLECCGEALNRGIDTDDSKLVLKLSDCVWIGRELFMISDTDRKRETKPL